MVMMSVRCLRPFVFGLAILLLSGLTPTPAARADEVGAVQLVTGTSVLGTAACATGHVCFAVGSSSPPYVGVVVPIVDGVLGRVVTVAGTSGLRANACPTSSVCLAVGVNEVGSSSQGVIVALSVSGDTVSPGPVQYNAAPELSFLGCPSSTACLALGNVRGAYGASNSLALPISVDGTTVTPGTSQQVANADFDGLACPSGGDCYALYQTCDPYCHAPAVLGIATTGTTATLGTPFRVAFRGALGCSSTSACFVLAGGEECANNFGQIKDLAVTGLTIQDGGAHCLTQSYYGGLGPVICQQGICLAGSGSNYIARIVNGQVSLPVTFQFSGFLDGLACASSTTCYGVGSEYNGSAQEGIVVPITIDSAVPTETPVPSGTGQNGWWRSLTVTWTIGTDGFAITRQSGCAATTITSDTTGGRLTCSVTAAGGTTSDTFAYKFDATAPTIYNPSILRNGTGQIVGAQYVVSDATSGLGSITTPTCTNCALSPLTFSPGAHSANVIVKKIDPSKPAVIGLKVTDVAGNVSLRDPVVALVGRGGSTPAVIVPDVSGQDGLVTVANGRPGLTVIRLFVNGQVVTVPPLAAGSQETVSIQAALHTGANTVLVLGLGPAGASAVLSFAPAG